MKTASHPIIAALVAHIVAECNAVDVEAAFAAYLDENYSFDSVGGPFASYQPSRVMREYSPTDFRCGCADFSDSEPWTEIAGEYYRDDELDTTKEAFADERRAELRELENEAEDDTEAGETVAADLAARIAAKEAEIDALEAHSF